MSYENTIKAKHEFQDSFSEFLTLLSVMTYREIEMTAAKLADSLSNNDVKIHQESAMFSGKIIQIFLQLRDKGEITESKMMRLFMRTKRGEFVKKSAAIGHAPILLIYKEEEKKVKEIRERQESEHTRLLETWQQERKKLSFLKRLFKSPPRPKKVTLTALPARPKSIHEYEVELSKKLSFGELLIYMASHYNFSYIEQSKDFANEDNVRSVSIKLLERK